MGERLIFGQGGACLHGPALSAPSYLYQRLDIGIEFTFFGAPSKRASPARSYDWQIGSHRCIDIALKIAPRLDDRLTRKGPSVRSAAAHISARDRVWTKGITRF
jgi:hypothetical protein